MARRKATGATKAVGKAYWGGVNIAEGRERGSASGLVAKCARAGGSHEACADAAKAGLKGRRKVRKDGKPWPRKSTPAMRAARKEFGKAAEKCKGKSRVKRNACVRSKLS